MTFFRCSVRFYFVHEKNSLHRYTAGVRNVYFLFVKIESKKWSTYNNSELTFLQNRARASNAIFSMLLLVIYYFLRFFFHSLLSFIVRSIKCLQLHIFILLLPVIVFDCPFLFSSTYLHFRLNCNVNKKYKKILFFISIYKTTTIWAEWCWWEDACFFVAKSKFPIKFLSFFSSTNQWQTEALGNVGNFKVSWYFHFFCQFRSYFWFSRMICLQIFHSSVFTLVCCPCGWITAIRI